MNEWNHQISGAKKSAAASPSWACSRCLMMNQAEPVRIYLFCYQFQVEAVTRNRTIRVEANIDDIAG